MRGLRPASARASPAGGDNCHYQGTVASMPESQVFASYCNGFLNGLLRLDRDYIVAHRKSDEGPLHALYPAAGYALEVLEKCKNDHTLDLQLAMSTSAGSERSRVKREAFDTEEKYVETLLVADHRMVKEYASEDIETYLLTIMNMVSGLFRHYTIGHAINIALVRMILLETPEAEFEVTDSAETVLRDFCRWQNEINPEDDDDPLHHDVAVLVTRHNICSRMNETCSTLGLAEVAGMCQPLRSCNINEDTGLSLAYTIAHEIGHNFGAGHDGPANGCIAEEGVVQNVMAPQITNLSVPTVWSNCSKQKITEFLARDWGYCLSDKPKLDDLTHYTPILPPGALYDVDHQCRLQYGSHASYCPGISEANFCFNLWCKVGDSCLSKMEAPADGTVCGQGKWCKRGRCVDMDQTSLLPIHGSWGDWTSWGPCSRTCGGGVQSSERMCDHPRPSNGGRFCSGERIRFRICETHDCPIGDPSFRAVQCSAFDHLPAKNGLFYRWTPDANKKNPCQLVCKPDGELFSEIKADIVADGTPCQLGSKNMCIRGRCRNVACDWQIDSTAKEDSCGVCHGNETHCEAFSGTFVAHFDGGSSEYHEVVRVPPRARNVKINEVVSSRNFLAIKSSGEDFYLNGGWYIQWNGEYQVAGAVSAHYERTDDLEEIFIPGPIEEPLVFMVLSQGAPVNITWEYRLLSSSAITPVDDYNWEYIGWTVCSRTCGGGFQEMQIKCTKRKSLVPVSDDHCEDKKSPPSKKRACNDHICPPQVTWWIGPWEDCPVSCGRGTRQRTILCVQQEQQIYEKQLKAELEREGLHIADYEFAEGSGSSNMPQSHDISSTNAAGMLVPLEDVACQGIEAKPETSETCPSGPLLPCPLESGYDVGEWIGECQKGDPCDVQLRNVTCVRLIPPCLDSEKPPSSRTCGGTECGHWDTSNWSHCSKSCGRGLRFRHVTCSKMPCNQRLKPKLYEHCNDDPCPASASYPRLELDTSQRKYEDGHGSGSDGAADSGSGEGSGSGFDGGPPSDHHTLTTPPSLPAIPMVPKTVFVVDRLHFPDDAREPGDGSGSGERPVGFVEDKIVPELYTLLQIPVRPNHPADPTPGKIEGAAAVDLLGQIRANRPENQNVSVLDLGELPSDDEDALVIDFDSEDEIRPKFHWSLGVWDQCSMPCDGGLRARKVSCTEMTTGVDVDNALCPDPRPLGEELCNNIPCEDWLVTKWSDCSEMCGPGTRRREVSCPLQPCNPLSQPVSEKTCNEQPCFQWIAGTWSSCTRKCGGLQKRRVACIDIRTENTSSGCSWYSRPPRFKECNDCD